MNELCALTPMSAMFASSNSQLKLAQEVMPPRLELDLSNRSPLRQDRLVELFHIALAKGIVTIFMQGPLLPPPAVSHESEAIPV
jgi:hypothetical protein